MEINFMNEYLVLVVLGICLCVGDIIKHMIPNDKINRYIPLILGGLGVVINSWLNAWALSPEILLGGLASGLASTGLHEAYKNLIGEK